MVLTITSAADKEEAARLATTIDQMRPDRAAAWLMREIRWAEEQWECAIQQRSSSKIQAREGLAVRIQAYKIFCEGLDSKGIKLHIAEEEEEGD